MENEKSQNLQSKGLRTRRSQAVNSSLSPEAASVSVQIASGRVTPILLNLFFFRGKRGLLNPGPLH